MEFLAKGIALAGCALGAGIALIAGVGPGIGEGQKSTPGPLELKLQVVVSSVRDGNRSWILSKNTKEFREEGIYFGSVSGSSPSEQGSHRGRILTQLGISHTLWRAESDRFMRANRQLHFSSFTAWDPKPRNSFANFYAGSACTR